VKSLLRSRLSPTHRYSPGGGGGECGGRGRLCYEINNFLGGAAMIVRLRRSLDWSEAIVVKRKGSSSEEEILNLRRVPYDELKALVSST
jgi:hypothetical protein